MKEGTQARKILKILFLFGIILVVSCILWLWRIHTFQPEAMTKVNARNGVDIPDSMRRPMLHTVHLGANGRAHLLDGGFTVSRLRKDMRPECDSTLESAFAFPPGAQALQSRTVEFAELGQPFQSSDDIEPDLPFRQFLLSGANDDHCFVYYQHGGVMYPRFCLVVMDQHDRKVIWAGEGRIEADDLADLRRMLAKGNFYDESGWTC